MIETMPQVIARTAGAWRPLSRPPNDITKLGFHVGASAYDSEDWDGRFYPPSDRTSSAPKAHLEKLKFYQTYFPFVEIDHTSSESPQITSFVDLERHSNESAKFSVRAIRISRSGDRDPTKGVDLIRKHIRAVGPLVEAGKFYSFHLQLEHTVFRSQEGLDYLLAVASEAVRARLGVHIEFRHASWHNHHVLLSLKDCGIGICNVELPRLKHAFPLKTYATTDKGYVRYCGLNPEAWKLENAKDGRYDYLYSEGEIEERVKGQISLSEKVSATAVVYNNYPRSQAAINAIQNIRQLHQAFEISRIMWTRERQ